MRRTLTNVFMLLAVPVTLLPIILGAADALEARRREHYWNMRREHMRMLALDRKRRALRARMVNEARPGEANPARPTRPTRVAAEP